jgi:hypothetical protein
MRHPPITRHPRALGTAINNPLRGTLTVIETVHYQQEDSEASTTDSRYSRRLGTNEQVYRRQMPVGKDWKKLDTGWIEQAGMLCLTNEDEQHTIYLGIDGVDKPATPTNPAEPMKLFALLPGESFRGHPVDINQLKVCCPDGDSTCTVFLVPS